MKHYLITISALLFIGTIAHAQETTPLPDTVSIRPTTYQNKNISMDSVIEPDYYKMDVTLAEYKWWTGRGRKSKSTLVDLDSLEKKLDEILDSLKIETPVVKTGLSVNSNPYYARNKHLLQATYGLQIKSREEVEALFKMLNELLPTVCFRGCFAQPYLSSLRLEEIKKIMSDKAEAKLLNEMELYAEKHGLEIKTANQTYTNIYLKPLGQNYQNIYYQNAPNQGFNLNLQHPNYSVMVTVNYTLQAR